MNLKDAQEQYGKIDGMYWYAVQMYEKDEAVPNKGIPHRVHSSVDIKSGVVILRNVEGVELIRVEVSVAKSSKRTSKSKGKRSNPKPEQLENSSD
jgi:hypothetical protein